MRCRESAALADGGRPRVGRECRVAAWRVSGSDSGGTRSRPHPKPPPTHGESTVSAHRVPCLCRFRANSVPAQSRRRRAAVPCRCRAAAVPQPAHHAQPSRHRQALLGAWVPFRDACSRHRRRGVHRARSCAGCSSASRRARRPRPAHVRRPPREPGGLRRAEQHVVPGDVADVRLRRVPRARGAVVNFAAETHVDRTTTRNASCGRTSSGRDVARRGARGRRAFSTSRPTRSTGPARPARRRGPTRCATSTLPPRKAAADLLAIAAARTHGQDVVITRCTNNYGPRQAPRSSCR